MAKAIQEMLEYAYQRKSEAFRIGDWEGRDYWDSQIRLIEADQQADNQRKLAAFPALVEALKAVEWIPAGDYEPFCPWCYTNQSLGHNPGCQRQAALALAKGEK